jgi:hypothetical protein
MAGIPGRNHSAFTPQRRGAAQRSQEREFVVFVDRHKTSSRVPALDAPSETAPLRRLRASVVPSIPTAEDTRAAIDGERHTSPAFRGASCLLVAKQFSSFRHRAHFADQLNSYPWACACSARFGAATAAAHLNLGGLYRLSTARLPCRDRGGGPPLSVTPSSSVRAGRGAAVRRISATCSPAAAPARPAVRV